MLLLMDYCIKSAEILKDKKKKDENLAHAEQFENIKSRLFQLLSSYFNTLAWVNM